MIKIGAILIFALLLFSASLVSASTRLLCIDKGQKIEFSRCNPSILDRTCTTKSGCQFCVNEASKGIYCPVSINNCNSGGFSCSSLESPNVVPAQNTNPPATPAQNTSTSTNTNTNTNNSINININNNQNTNTQTNTQTNTNTNTLTIKPKVGTGIKINSKTTSTGSTGSTDSNTNTDVNNSSSNQDTGKSIFGLNSAEFSLDNPIARMLMLSMILELIITVYVLRIYSKIRKM